VVLSVSQANKIYNYSAQLEVISHTVAHSTFRNFSLSLKRFEKSLGFELTATAYWHSFLAPIKQYMYDLILTPLPFNNPLLIKDATLNFLMQHLYNCDKIYPSYAAQAWEILEQIVTLSQIDENPLLSSIIDKIGVSNDTTNAILLKNTRLVTAVESELNTFYLSELLVPVSLNQLRVDATFDTVFYTGPLSWLPPFILASPRTSNFYYFKYDWIYDPRKKHSVFLNDNSFVEKADENKYQTVSEDKTEVGTSYNTDYINVTDIEIKTDWDLLLTNYSKQALLSNDEELVEARLLILEEGVAVLLEDTLSENLLVLDFEQISSTQSPEYTNYIKRLAIDNVEPNMFILLRTGGGGDYIVTLANKILGNQSVKLRESQEHWKNLLRKSVKSRGIRAVIQSLIEKGSTHVSEMNLRNWMSARTIRPFFENDFKAILQYVGLFEDYDQYLKATKLIYSAHRRAGFQIRNLLLQQVLRADLSRLTLLGRMDFMLPGEDGGSFTAIRVREVSKNSATVRLSQLGSFIGKDHNLWLA
jgi:hypothetical protein